jgi:hypothetical protein
MRTLDQLKLRCDIDVSDPDACWIFPKTCVCLSVHVCGRRNYRVSPSRAAWYLAGRGAPPTGTKIYTECGTGCRCGNPDHLYVATFRQFILSQLADGTRQITGSDRLRLRSMGRKTLRCTSEMAREIMASSESAGAVARRLGISKTVALRVRRGEHTSAKVINPWLALLP